MTQNSPTQAPVPDCSLRVLDLFAGCGGLSLGFQRAGFSVAAGVEQDRLAALTHASNLYAHCDGQALDIHAQPRDITAFGPEECLAEILLPTTGSGDIDVIVGGPPCQAFARIGRAKLGHVNGHPEAFLDDPRARLYRSFIEYVDFFRPTAVLIENVPEIMQFGGQNIAEEIADELSELGYCCRYSVLNAVHFGVPQMRARFFLIAVLDELGVVPEFPEPTHRYKLPAGYQFAAWTPDDSASKPGADTCSRYIRSTLAGKIAPYAVPAGEAIGDLPAIRWHLEGRLEERRYTFDELTRYTDDRSISSYEHEMRTWRGFESNDGVLDHVIRYLPRDAPIFARMKQDDQYPQAHSIALQLFEKALDRKQESSGHRPKDGDGAYAALRKAIVPPYDTTKFPNKWWKLRRHAPVRTLTAHMSKDTYSHIHYDDTQARVISVREAARLQSFPDGFRFSGTLGAGYRQIGNAVPPLLAYALACKIRDLITEASQPESVPANITRTASSG